MSETEIVPTSEGMALAITSGSPKEIVARATEMAETLREVINKQHLYNDIQGKKYVRVEGWTTLGAMVGVFPTIEWSRPIDKDGQRLGWEARCEVKTPNGNIIGAAEAECTYEEQNWRKRDDYALRSMAQTRAVSKAMRVPLSWVMTLAGFEATPAEEMPAAGLFEPGPPIPSYDARAASPPPPKKPPSAPTRVAPAPPAPAPVREDDQARPITTNQISAILGALSRAFKGDERLAYQWMRSAEPKACQKSETEIHLGDLTMAEASALIAKLNEELRKA